MVCWHGCCALPSSLWSLLAAAPATTCGCSCRACRYGPRRRPVEVDVQPYDTSQGGSGPQDRIRAVAFVTPARRCIADGLPPSQRYLDLIRWVGVVLQTRGLLRRVCLQVMLC